MFAIRRKFSTMALVALFSPCLLACDAPTKSNMMQKFELKNGALHTSVSLPVGFVGQQSVENLLVFRLQYPSLKGHSPDDMPKADTVDVFLELAARSDSSESLVREALEQFDPARPNRPYRLADAAEAAQYTVYQHFTGRPPKQQVVFSYVFTAQDGALVAVEDPGSWTKNYVFTRRIGKDLHLKYLVAKDIGRDFIKIDGAVSQFTKSLIH